MLYKLIEPLKQMYPDMDDIDFDDCLGLREEDGKYTINFRRSVLVGSRDDLSGIDIEREYGVYGLWGGIVDRPMEDGTMGVYANLPFHIEISKETYDCIVGTSHTLDIDAVLNDCLSSAQNGGTGFDVRVSDAVLEKFENNCGSNVAINYVNSRLSSIDFSSVMDNPHIDFENGDYYFVYGLNTYNEDGTIKESKIQKRKIDINSTDSYEDILTKCFATTIDQNVDINTLKISEANAYIANFGKIVCQNGKYYVLFNNDLVWEIENFENLSVDEIIAYAKVSKEWTDVKIDDKKKTFVDDKGRYVENANTAFKPCISLKDSDLYYEICDKMKAKISDVINNDIINGISDAKGMLSDSFSDLLYHYDNAINSYSKIIDNIDILRNQIDIAVSIYSYCDRDLKDFLDNFLLGNIFCDFKDFDKQKWSENMEKDVGDLLDEIIDELTDETNELYGYLNGGLIIPKDIYDEFFGVMYEKLSDPDAFYKWAESKGLENPQFLFEKLSEISCSAVLPKEFMNQPGYIVDDSCDYLKDSNGNYILDKDGNKVRGFFGYHIPGDYGSLIECYIESTTDKEGKYVNDNICDLIGIREDISSDLIELKSVYEQQIGFYNERLSLLDDAKKFRAELPYLKYTTTDEYKEIRKNLLNGFNIDGKEYKLKLNSDGSIANAGDFSTLLGISDISLLTPEELSMCLYLKENNADLLKKGREVNIDGVTKNIASFETILNFDLKKRKGKKAALDAIEMFLKDGDLDIIDDFLAGLWGTAKAGEDFFMGFAKLVVPEIGLTCSDYTKQYFLELLSSVTHEPTMSDFANVSALYDYGAISYNEYVTRMALLNHCNDNSSIFDVRLLLDTYNICYDFTSTGINLAVTALTNMIGLPTLGIILNAASKAGTASAKEWETSFGSSLSGNGLGLDLKARAVGVMKFSYEFVKYFFAQKVLFGRTEYDRVTVTDSKGNVIDRFVNTTKYDGLVDLNTKWVGDNSFWNAWWNTYLKGRITAAAMSPGDLLVGIVNDALHGNEINLGGEVFEVTEDFWSDDLFVALTSIVVNSVGDELDLSSVPDAGDAETNAIKTFWSAILKNIKPRGAPTELMLW